MGVVGADTAKAPIVADATRQRHIAECAYYIAEKRLFAGGDSVQDWLKAEQQISSLVR